jgi:hypothetical protein
MGASDHADRCATVPLRFRLSQNFPNPFRDRTVIKYCVAYSTRVRLTVYDRAGAFVEQLLDAQKKAGTYEAVFAPGLREEHIAAGSYTYRFEAGYFLDEKEMELTGYAPGGMPVEANGPSAPDRPRP